MKEYFWLCYFLAHTLVDLTGSIESNLCSSMASLSSIPIVNFCENNQGGNEVILIMNGSLAESIPTVTSCSCIITTSNATTLYFSHTSTVPVEITPGCGSELSIKNSTGNGILVNCTIQGRMEVRNDEYLHVVITKKSINASTNYCVYINQENGNARINARCSNSTDSIGIDITTSKSTKYVAQYSTEQTPTETQFSLVDTSTSKTSEKQSSSTSAFLSVNYTNYIYNTTNENIVTILTDANMIMYYAIGGGGGGVVVVILAVVTVVLCRRCSSKKSQKNEKSDEDEADDLQYNMLYVSADNTDIDTNTVDRHGLSNDTEVTYSTVDIEETERSNDKHLNQNYDLPNIKNTILPATLITPKCLASESGDNATVEKSCVTHVTAPGGGSEYAVVSKQEKNNVTDSVGNTYAVVNKTWK